LEDIIDALHEPHSENVKKPRAYRQKSRKAYLEVAKQRRVEFDKLRMATGKQLKFIARNIRIIEQIADITPITILDK
jgi:IS5 family transposase